MRVRLLAAIFVFALFASCRNPWFQFQPDGDGTVQVDPPAYPVTYAVTVTGGTGSGNYAEGATVTITADTPPEGQQFKNWTASPSVTFANAGNANTTFAMPPNAVTVTANFEQIPTYAVTVNNGTGSGNYAQGTTVTITAGTAPSGQQFKNWTASPSVTFANAADATTTFTMPPNAVTVTANFEAAAPTGTPVSGNTLAAKLAWVSENAASNTAYALEVDADETLAPHTLTYSASNITVILWSGTGAQEIGLSGNGTLFTVESGVTLVLENNITLQGRTANNASLVRVNAGGKLEMNAGSKITGNQTTNGSGVYVTGANATFTMNGGEIFDNTASDTGGGVYVGANATFTMNGGTISGNQATTGTGATNGNISGAGVHISNGTFTMNDGTISDNTADGNGGGVCVTTEANSKFTMNGGTISDNTASIGTTRGGGVYVGNTFTMTNGTISGNYAAQGAGICIVNSVTFTMDGGTISGNTSGNLGGGVHVFQGTFTMNGGTISGNTAGSGGGISTSNTASNKFQIVNGTVYGSNEGDTSLRNTATTGAALLVNSGTAQRGTFSGANGAWVSKGNLSPSTNDTIKVVNGEIAP